MSEGRRAGIPSMARGGIDESESHHGIGTVYPEAYRTSFVCRTALFCSVAWLFDFIVAASRVLHHVLYKLLIVDSQYHHGRVYVYVYDLCHLAGEEHRDPLLC